MPKHAQQAVAASRSVVPDGCADPPQRDDNEQLLNPLTSLECSAAATHHSQPRVRPTTFNRVEAVSIFPRFSATVCLTATQPLTSFFASCQRKGALLDVEVVADWVVIVGRPAFLRSMQHARFAGDFMLKFRRATRLAWRHVWVARAPLYRPVLH